MIDIDLLGSSMQVCLPSAASALTTNSSAPRPFEVPRSSFLELSRFPWRERLWGYGYRSPYTGTKLWATSPYSQQPPAPRVCSRRSAVSEQPCPAPLCIRGSHD
eukprot:RCo039430